MAGQSLGPSPLRGQRPVCCGRRLVIGTTQLAFTEGFPVSIFDRLLPGPYFHGPWLCKANSKHGVARPYGAYTRGIRHNGLPACNLLGVLGFIQ